MRIAQILYDKAHWIFEAEEMPDYPPGPEGDPIILIDITGRDEIQEGWDYDSKTREFIELVYEEIAHEEQQPTSEEIANATYLETQYQTVLLELLSGL